MLKIELGCRGDLHMGAHAPLWSSPPAGMTYARVDVRHRFLTRAGEGQFSPHAFAHGAECVSFPAGAALVHSVRWPVFGHPRWIVDMDDFAMPCVSGRYGLNPEFARLRQLEPLRTLTRERMENMVAAYAHPSCRAILLRTQDGVRHARRWLASWTSVTPGIEAAKQACSAKMTMIYPAMQPLSPGAFEAKWNRRPLSVVFCGTDYESKNGALALDVIESLRDAYPDTRFIYVGHLPEPVARQRGALLRSIVHYAKLPRAEMLALLADSHILFHPSHYESVGIILMEAGAAGMAVVTAKGQGMSHTPELFGERGAQFVDRDTMADDSERTAFRASLAGLLADPGHARVLGSYNRENAASGPISLPERDRALAGIVHQALATPANGPSLLPADLPHAAAMEECEMSRQDLHSDLLSWLDGQRGLPHRVLL